MAPNPGPRKYAGLVLMGLGVIVVLAVGAFAFQKAVTVELAITVIAATVLLVVLPGFLLHIVATVRARRGGGA